MNTETLRRTAQIFLAAVAVVAAAVAAFLYLNRGDRFVGERVETRPLSGPVGMRPIVLLHGYDPARVVTVYMCAGTTSDLKECAKLASGPAGKALVASAIPSTLPDGTDVVPNNYELRVGPDVRGDFPARGQFLVIPFRAGRAPTPFAFAGVAPDSLVIGTARQIARGEPCRPPVFLPDGRLAIGSTVLDPATGVTVRFKLDAAEVAWSPLGDKLAMITSDHKEIRLAAPDGSGAVTKVREARGLLSSLSWSPDGDRLAYIAEDDPAIFGGPGPPTVRILNAINGDQATAGPGIGVAWSSKPDLLAVEMSGLRIESSTAGGARRSFTTGRRPAWSPDGSFLVVNRQPPSGIDEGWIMRADGSAATKIAGDGVCAMSFSPKGTELAIVVYSGGHTTLFLRTVGVAGRKQ